MQDINLTNGANEAPKKETKWSYSKLSTYKQCGFRYKLQYVDKHYVDTSTAATTFGTALHLAEETIANSIKAKEPIDYVAIKNKYIMDNLKNKYTYLSTWYDKDKSDRTYEEKMYLYLEKAVYGLEHYLSEHPELEVVGAEVPVDFRYKEKRFTGSIDRLLRNTITGEYIIQDIKSWPRIDEHEDELTTPLQFVVYTLAASEMFNIPVEKITCQYDLPLSEEQRLYDAGTKGFLTRGSDKLDKLFEGIESQNFKPNPTPLCHWCAYSPTNPKQPEAGKFLCPYYSLWTQERKNFGKAMEWRGLDKHEEVMTEYFAKIKKEGCEF